MANEKLLVVDDERDFVEIIAERLGAKGYTIIKAYDGKDGLEKAILEKPDLIVLDIAMPEMNGYDCCLKIKENKDLKNTPVIMLTAKFQPNDIEFAKEIGADAYLTKPLELDTLLNKVRELLKAKT